MAPGSGSPDRASASGARSHIALIVSLDAQQLLEGDWPALCIELLGGVHQNPARARRAPARHHEFESARNSEEKS